MNAYIHPVSDREPLAWIVQGERTAFSEGRRAEAEALEPDDTLFLYATRGAFRNPTRDRGRVMGRAAVRGRARRAPEPIGSGDRTFPFEVELSIELLCPPREGVELAPLVRELAETFPDPRSWSVRLRRALVPLAPADAERIDRLLEAVALPYREVRDEYRT